MIMQSGHYHIMLTLYYVALFSSYFVFHIIACICLTSNVSACIAIGIPMSHHLIYRIDGDGVIKVADFGLTEDMYNTKYYRHGRSNGGNEEKVPIRWMAPESIEADLYSESTDVVSLIQKPNM